MFTRKSINLPICIHRQQHHTVVAVIDITSISTFLSISDLWSFQRSCLILLFVLIVSDVVLVNSDEKDNDITPNDNDNDNITDDDGDNNGCIK